MYIIKSGRVKINIEGIWSSVGVDLQELLMDADTAARHEFAILNGQMMPYATQTSVMAGELNRLHGSFCGLKMPKVRTKSLIQIDVVVFADKESESKYIALNKDGDFFITREQLQDK